MPRSFMQAFPLIDGTKRPAVKWGDPAACRPAESFGGARHGLPTGPRNGFWVLDLDAKPGATSGLASFDAFAAGRGVSTYTVRTPGGGYHLYFAWSEGRNIGNPIGILPGVDVRGDGGYVCAGGEYTVAVDGPIYPAPEWLLEIVTSRSDAAAQVKGEAAHAITPEHPEWAARIAMAQKYIAGEPPCIEGEGQSEKQTFKMGLRLSRTYELPVETSMPLLADYIARAQPSGYIADKMRRSLIRAAEEGQGPTGTFARSFLSGAQPGKIPAPVEGGEWRRKHDPNHKYTVDLQAEVAGALQKTNSLDPKALTATFAGPGALGGVWTGVWQYDSFRRRTVAVNPPFKLDADIARGGPGISKRDLASVAVWISCNGGKATKEQIADAIDVAARHAEHHPVRDYLAALPAMTEAEGRVYYDGIAGRLWGATEERSDLESGHLMRLAIAAVRRIKVPGTKVDTMLVLAGEQGFRKSLLCAHLFGDFFLDQLPPISSGRGHEASIAIEGRWGVEIAEMNALAHAHESAKKEFLTRCTDKYRPVFGIAMQEVPRQCVFVGTTNDDDFLTDPTGDTRYDICDIRQPIDLASLDRDAFWAAAVALEAAGVSHYRDRALLARAKSAALDAADDGILFANGGVHVPPALEGAAFAAEDAWADDIITWARANATEANDGDYVTCKGCMRGLGLPLERQDARAQSRVKGVLRLTFGASHVKWIDGRVQRCYRVR